MRHATTTRRSMTIGLDLGDRQSFLCALSPDGEVLAEDTIRTTQRGVREFFGDLEPSTVILEAGTHSGWVERELRRLEHHPIVANPRQLPLIYRNPGKNDRADALNLARVGRLDPALLCPVRQRSEEAQLDRLRVGLRGSLVRSRTALINFVRSSVKSFGARLPSCDAAYFHRRAREALAELELPELKTALEPAVKQIEILSRSIHQQDREIRELAQQKYPETRRLTQVHGVGALVALVYVLTIEDARRFAKSRSVGAFLGMTPRRSQSGDHEPQLRITKAGDPYLRQLLVTSAHCVLRSNSPDSDLKRHGEAIARRGGKNAKKRAVVAVARKLAVLLHRLWISGERYEPLRNAQQSV